MQLLIIKIYYDVNTLNSVIEYVKILRIKLKTR